MIQGRTCLNSKSCIKSSSIHKRISWQRRLRARPPPLTSPRSFLLFLLILHISYIPYSIHSPNCWYNFSLQFFSSAVGSPNSSSKHRSPKAPITTALVEKSMRGATDSRAGHCARQQAHSLQRRHKRWRAAATRVTIPMQQRSSPKTPDWWTAILILCSMLSAITIKLTKWLRSETHHKGQNQVHNWSHPCCNKKEKKRRKKKKSCPVNYSLIKHIYHQSLPNVSYKHISVMCTRRSFHISFGSYKK